MQRRYRMFLPDCNYLHQSVILIHIIMANKRNLKKEINAIASALVGEYLLTREFVPGVDIEKANVVLRKVFEMRKEFVARVGANGGNDRKQVKAYYKQLRADFNAKVDEIISDFEEMTK